MWGICFDTIEYGEGIFPSRLFQSVVEYKLSEDGTMANIIYPEKGVSIAAGKIIALGNPPQLTVGELVSPVSHPDQIGVVCGIKWHFKDQTYLYFISINGKKKSKRYYFHDLIKR